MRIINKTKNSVLAENALIADSWPKRTKGLLGRKAFERGEALVIDPCNSVHTFFMAFAIDVLFVDKDNRVIKAVSNLKPFRMTAVVISSAYVIELPSGTIARTNTAPPDLLST